MPPLLAQRFLRVVGGKHTDLARRPATASEEINYPPRDYALGSGYRPSQASSYVYETERSSSRAGQYSSFHEQPGQSQRKILSERFLSQNSHPKDSSQQPQKRYGGHLYAWLSERDLRGLALAIVNIETNSRPIQSTMGGSTSSGGRNRGDQRAQSSQPEVAMCICSGLCTGIFLPCSLRRTRS